MATRSTKRQRASTAADTTATAPDIKTAQTATDEVSVNEVADLAYRLFLTRGGGHGHDLDDWYEAERQLRALRS